MNQYVLSFDEGIAKIGLNKSGLRVEGFRTDGTSNYLANLNCQGQTWAAVVRLPAKGADLQEFLGEKRQALVAVEYLVEVLRDGIDVGFDCVLKFDGVSCLVENASTQAFLRYQAEAPPISLVDNIDQRQKEIQGFRYPQGLPDDTRDYILRYSGPFYLSRGAPAWETLEEYPEFEEPVAHALALLHLATGSGVLVSYDSALRVLREIEADLLKGVEGWSPEDGSKEQLALAKALKKWKAADDADRLAIVRRERFLRTSRGKDVYRTAFERAVGRQKLPDHPMSSFCHGDCHGGNFILVRYHYVLNHPEVMVDRIFLNEIFANDQSLFEVAITIDEKNAQIIHSAPSDKNRSAILARRCVHHEIHPVDLDNGTGTTEGTKVLHLYDALSYSLSMSNITRLWGAHVDAAQVLSHYYDGLGGMA